MENTWKPAIGYEGRYEVSDDGQVRSLLRKGKLLKPAKNFHGYKQVILYQDGTPKSIYVHRLVAMAYIANQNNLPWVNHKNGIKDDNCVVNLEWCDRASNIRHAVETGLMYSPSGENNPMSKLSNLDRRVIVKLLGMGFSQQLVADLFEMTQSGISRLVKKEW